MAVALLRTGETIASVKVCKAIMGLFFVVRCYEKRRRARISLLLITAVLKVLGAFQGKALEAAGQRADNAPLEVHADSFGLHWGKAWHATKTTQKKRKEKNQTPTHKTPTP